MNANRRAKVKELIASGLSPKAAYVEMMKYRIKGRRKSDAQTQT